ncbi:MAG: MBL fold metallo-hydrolase [Bacteroidota bacterium]
MALAEIGFSLPLPLLSKDKKDSALMGINRQNSPFYHFKIGAFRATVISDGQSLFPAYPMYAVNASEIEVTKNLQAFFLPTNDYLLQCNSLLLERGKEKILIDTGAGNSLGNGFGLLNKHLRLLNISGDQITSVLLTHCHLDHIGGLMINHNPSFPKATIYLNEKEWNFWSAKSVDLKSMPIEQEFRDNFKNAVATNLVPLNHHIKTFHDDEEIISGIHAVEANGHSPGHTCFWIKSSSDSLLHTGDIFHNPAFDLKNPDWATAFDQDAKQAYRTRIKILDMAVFERANIMSYHMPFPSFGHLTKKGKGYGWRPSNWIIAE